MHENAKQARARMNNRQHSYHLRSYPYLWAQWCGKRLRPSLSRVHCSWTVCISIVIVNSTQAQQRSANGRVRVGMTLSLASLHLLVVQGTQKVDAKYPFGTDGFLLARSWSTRRCGDDDGSWQQAIAWVRMPLDPHARAHWIFKR